MDIQGKVVKVKLVRYGFPIETAVVKDLTMARYGNMRVQLEDGSVPMALYPPIEVLGDPAVAKV